MPWVDLPGEYQFVFEAIDPTTGSAVTGVSVSQIAIYGLDESVSVAAGTVSYEPLDILVLPQRG